MSAHNVFPFVVLFIPIIAIMAGVAKKWLDLKQKQLEVASIDAAEKAAQYVAKTERLEQRVAVLERILTDRSTHLADEIDRLRDQPLN
jgi:hypothetical protein